MGWIHGLVSLRIHVNVWIQKVFAACTENHLENGRAMGRTGIRSNKDIWRTNESWDNSAVSMITETPPSQY